MDPGSLFIGLIVLVIVGVALFMVFGGGAASSGKAAHSAGGDPDGPRPEHTDVTDESASGRARGFSS